MNFIGSARKWRPQRFEELIGQEHIRRTLSNALEANRIASAYLFSGTRGVGKTTTARILAKSLNCESSDGPVADPCNECSSCEEVNRGSHPDVLEIDGATYTGVDHVRDLREGLRYRPARGRYKTVIIDEVHMLSKGAFNALLKTLEEPPPHVVFIFATTESHRVPETILSRCQVFEFRRIAPGIITEQLSRIVQEQSLNVEEDALRLLGRMGEGSMRDAQSLLDQVIAFSGESTLTAREVEGVLGVPPSEVYWNIISGVIERDTRAALKELNEIFEAGYDLRIFCGNLLEYLRDLMVLQTAGDGEELFNLTASEMEERKKLTQKLSFAETHQAYSFLQNCEFELRSSTHPRMTLELAIIRMCRIEAIVDLEKLIERIESQTSTRTPLPPPAPDPAQKSDRALSSQAVLNPPVPGGTSLGENPGSEGSAPVTQAVYSPWSQGEAEKVWGEALKSLRPSQRGLLMEAEVNFATEGLIKISLLANNGHAQAFEAARKALVSLEAYFSANAPWCTKVVLEDSAQEEPLSVQTMDHPLESERKRKQESEEMFIEEVIDIFNGQISNVRRVRDKGGQAHGDQ